MSVINAPGFIAEVNKFSGNKLKYENDILLLVNTVVKNGKIELFENLVFTAKYINGLKRVLKAGSGNPEIRNFEQIKGDMINNYQKLADQIKTLLEGEDNVNAKNFREGYLSVNEGSFEKLNALLDDLEWVKMFLNEQKRR